MELKRILDRANVLLLQGAYQGAESFIEQAMEEADKLKQELAEIDTLRTRVTEMAAEVERLQGLIDAANAQGPVATIDVHFDTSDYELDEDRKLTYVFKGKTLEQLGIGRHNLYAHPIPAQQSPENKELTFYGNVNVSEAIAMVEQQSPAVVVPDETISEAYLRGYKDAAKEYTESPRITEQDAREIVMSAWRYWMNGYGRTIDTWSEEEWPNVFNKINGDQNGK